MQYAFRELVAADRDFLVTMLRLALGWRLVPPADGSPLPVAVPARVFDDLGRAGDGGVVATCAGEPAGACWYRLVPGGAAGASPAADAPELTVAVLPEHRARGVGGELLDRAIEQAAAAGFAALGLTVEVDNPARGMYERRGFEVVRDDRTSLAMRRGLGPPVALPPP